MSPRISRLSAYGVVSTGLAAAVVASALQTRPNFFAAAVSVGRSSGALMVLANFTLYVAICVGVGFKNVFFGELRPIEYEHLFERLWIFLTESLFALTIFRSDFSIPFALLYGVLVFLKCFHWVTADRVDYLDQVPPPGPPWGFHIRVATVTALLTFFDALLFMYATESVLVDGVSAMLLFASEFAILLVAIAGTWARYTVGLIDLRRAGGRADAPTWEEKSMYLFYIDLAADFAKLLTYLVFFIVIYLNYGLPVYILRDVYMTLRSLVSRGGDLFRYRRATRNMDQLYPDATGEELDRMGDHTCIICREEMVARERLEEGQQRQDGGPNETPKKLACGHIFHFHCLRSWLERQQSCPTCRRDVLGAAPGPGAADRVRNARNAAAAAAAAAQADNQPQPAAPGARPGDAPALPDPTRAMFEEYFRLPAVNGDAPVPVQTGAPPARSESAPPDVETADHRVQRSIWGAPIVPGRFAPPALGASPRPWLERETGAASAAGGLARTAVTRGSRPESGATTPFASQAPVVFSSTGSPVRLSHDSGSRPAEGAGPTGAERERAAETTANPEAPVEEDFEPTFDDDDIPIREAVRLAALRRAGLAPASSPSPVASDKGKGKAVDPAPPQPAPPAIDPFDAAPTHHAYLAPTSPFPASTVASSVCGAPPATPAAARAALDERLTMLREVDDVVWNLVGELSRLKSQWAVEDATIGGVAGSRAASPAVPVAATGEAETLDSGEELRLMPPAPQQTSTGVSSASSRSVEFEQE